ncbi:MAG: helix-turn-helix transcriptional regulator [Anaerolineae bacterium]|nr:helix-turn-helix transcriptional regulator [Anaerolineae bacterium]
MSRLTLEGSIQRFGEKLRMIRLEKKMTLRQFAEALGYSAHGYISELEAGKKIPTLEFVLEVARTFHVSLDELLKDSLDTGTHDAKDSPLMSLAFVYRPPTTPELERFRLLLSTYQDGSGMLAQSEGRTLPGWRDFERAVAAAFNGENQENKFIFDVLIADATQPIKYGISCKMRGELNRIDKDGRVTIELSNSSKKFKDHLSKKGILPQEYAQRPTEVGTALIELIESWKRDVSITQGGKIDLAKSSYLTLMYNRLGLYQLHWFKITLPNPLMIRWYYPEAKGQQVHAGHLNGDDEQGGRLFEWYSESGGQLKYYPLAADAIWASPRFQLEPLPEKIDKAVLQAKAESYFPELWRKLSER